MRSDLDKILISADQIAKRVAQMALQITQDHTPPVVSGEAEITILPIMTGAMIFCADLIRNMPIKMKIGLLTVSSYPGKSIKSQGPSLLTQQLEHIRGRHVLVLDDILDSGGTIRFVRPMLEAHAPASIKTCVLLRKPTDGAKATPVDYVGFDIPDEFVVGYGLDYDDHYRNLPEIATLRSDVIK